MQTIFKTWALSLWWIGLPVSDVFSQTDTIAPALHCKLEVNTLIPPTGYLTLNAADFIDSMSDNSGNMPETGIRKPCTGEGFPSQTTLTYLYTGVFQVEVWARDGQGNTSHCQTRLFIGDLGNGPISRLTVQVEDPEMRPVGGVQLRLDADHCEYGQFSETSETGSEFPLGNATFQAPEPGAQVNLCGKKSRNDLNGITTFDLVLIHKHISGVEVFWSPYQRLAADANLDGLINQQDLLLLRDLILGIRREFPGGQSWRIFPENYPFETAFSPAGQAVAPCILTPQYPDSGGGIYKMVAIKIGDVNFSADPNQ